jgi:hypothetical protein
MNTIQPRILTIGGQWPRFVIVQDSPGPDACPQFWDGEKWVRELRAARLYAHKKFVRGDLKKVRGEA